VYKPALSHQEAMSVMIESCHGHFDPVLFQVFQQNADKFEKLYQELAD
jgi:HD-GYP domain-containing protein (c-di-GMP phosphodiesterase class II)